MQTQGRNFFSVRGYHADDRISNKKTCYSLENLEVSQHKVTDFASSNIGLDLHDKLNVKLGTVQQVYNVYQHFKAKSDCGS